MKHKDAKVTTTTIPAHAKLEKPHMRKRNTDLENENFRLKSELSQARRAERLAVLGEVKTLINEDRKRLRENGLLSKTDKGYTRAIMIIEEAKEAAK